MDKWLEKDLKEFSSLMNDKGYKGSFLVNNHFSEELMAAAEKCYWACREQGSDMFPLIVHVLIKGNDEINTALMRLRLDQTDQGIQVRDGTMETIKINGITRNNVDISFINTKRFPSKDELLEKLNKKFSKKIKTKNRL